MNDLTKKLMTTASILLGIAGMIFIALSIFGYQRTWTLPAALVCVSLSLIFQTIFRLRDK